MTSSLAQVLTFLRDRLPDGRGISMFAYCVLAAVLAVQVGIALWVLGEALPLLF